MDPQRVCLNGIDMNKIITALYCRISREDELITDSSSIETQKAYLTRYANQNKYFNTRFYIDDGYSGTNFERPGFLELKSDIENELVKLVITKVLSRLGRDYLMTGYYIEHYFPSNNVRFIAINDQVDTLKSDNDFAPFRNIMNEWYARDISKKIRSAYKTKALNGEFTGAYPPYGYDKNPNNKHQLVINNQKALIVRQIYDLYLDGTSIYKIARILKGNKVYTPRTDLYKTQGAYESEHVKKYPYEWAPQTVMSILMNEVYIGTIICNKHQTKTFKTKELKRNPESKWIKSKNKHKPIIKESIFKIVQQIILKNKRLPRTPHINIFKGKVRCNNCGKTLSLSMRNDRTVYGSLSCSTYRRYGKEKCSSHYITYDYLVEHITIRINELIELSKLGEKRFTDKIIRKTSLIKSKELLGSELRKLLKRQEDITILVKKMFEKYINDKITESKFYELDTIYDLEKQEIQESIKLIEDEINKINLQINDISTFYMMISKYNEIKDLTREDIVKLIDRIIIEERKGSNKKRLVEVYFKLIGKM
jgi:DNA invertase Pin-like site-specific DNA recombinase